MSVYDPRNTPPDVPEQWRPHPGQYAGYEVSTLGGARNATTGRMLTPYPWVNDRGYCRVLVCLPGRPVRGKGKRSRGSRRVAVARLVLETFVGPPPFPKAMALHVNGESEECHLSNLYWGDPVQNAADLARHRAAQAAAEELAAVAAGPSDDIPF